MYKVQEFRDYMLNTAGLAASTYNTYNSFLGRIDQAIGGLDEALARDGTDKVLEWSRTTSTPPFDVFPSHARSVLNKYIQFHIDAQSPDTQEVQEEMATDAQQASGLAFRLEKEMQAAVRKQLSNLEAGLVEDDEGRELAVSTGYIDIVARDKLGKLVVIELKAGMCPTGALEQALGYAQALSEERNEDVRVMLIASDFSDRLRAAAKRANGLQLLKYEFSLQFNELK
ncbi:MAG: hypothetical protein BGN91_06035 [Nitrobacter sp. 62-13]|nr:MAG: hypothetical protein BGN91_06035 [Nitrobacter sp. 62-13]